ncbi:MAG: UrcA family protein [Gammaproteobacteria bacterium]|nr:UrcA family protein [Gammaproteobacteria bacterium]MBV9726925.1 UrcA family protein [Gammaproteobacteria bacterium]
MNDTMSRSHSRSFLFPLLAVAAAAVTPQSLVQAADRSQDLQHSQKVAFSDLNLTKAQGTVTLYRRIRAAARTVCGPLDIGFADERADWNRCVDDAIADAVAKVADASLTDYHLLKTNRSRTSLAHR